MCSPWYKQVSLQICVLLLLHIPGKAAELGHDVGEHLASTRKMKAEQVHLMKTILMHVPHSSKYAICSFPKRYPFAVCLGIYTAPTRTNFTTTWMREICGCEAPVNSAEGLYMHVLLINFYIKNPEPSCIRTVLNPTDLLQPRPVDRHQWVKSIWVLYKNTNTWIEVLG